MDKILKKVLTDIKNLKLKAYEPSKIEAQAYLEYFSWEENSSKKGNFEILYTKELELLNEWLKVCCEIYKCSKEEALDKIINNSKIFYQKYFELLFLSKLKL